MLLVRTKRVNNTQHSACTSAWTCKADAPVSVHGRNPQRAARWRPDLSVNVVQQGKYFGVSILTEEGQRRAEALSS